MISSLAFALLLATSPVDPTQSINADPPIDAAHPASSLAAQFKSHGATINALIYRPAGAGLHPTVLLFHGLPGNEQNLDLARALQRAGWTVVTFHYRGSWGSGGEFTLVGGDDDADALIEALRDPKTASAWGVDPAHMVVVGHSYGGFIAAATAARHPEILASVLIAPWDLSFDQRAWSKLTPQALAQTSAEGFDDVEGRLGGVTVASLTDDLLHHGASLDLAKLAPALANRPVFILTATRDDPDDQAGDLIPALAAAHAAQVKIIRMDTDHPFNDRRIELEADVVRWLAPFSH
ncbi:MAG TPA: alpha/beta fold hydrolase [Caulobacteraceae bacterium]|jgi:pimeloyl-ACP methyl ester carboxylesterase